MLEVLRKAVNNFQNDYCYGFADDYVEPGGLFTGNYVYYQASNYKCCLKYEQKHLQDLHRIASMINTKSQSVDWNAKSREKLTSSCLVMGNNGTNGRC